MYRSGRNKRRIFLSFMVVNWAAFIATTYLLWVIGYPGLYQINPQLPAAIGAVLAGIHLFLMLGFGLIVLTIITGYEFFLSQRLRKLSLKLFLPLTIHGPFTLLVGKLLKLNKEDIQRSFIELNNHLIQVKRFSLEPKQVLVLLPQCLQNSDCKVRLTYDIYNCKLCGKCQIKKIVSLCRYYGVRAYMATGGTLARKIVLDQNPRAIVAIACERELVSGIEDCYPLPVVGIQNLRPRGPCTETEVDVTMLEQAMSHLLGDKPTLELAYIPPMKAECR